MYSSTSDQNIKPNDDVFKVVIKSHTDSDPWTYEKLDHYQRELKQKVLQNPNQVYILLSEVSPVITLSHRGFERLKDNFTLSFDFIKNSGVSFFETDRGGNATYHGKGQWVVFVIGKLERLTGDAKGVRKMIVKLLNMALDVTQKYVPESVIRDGDEWGIWSSPQKSATKLVSCGIKISQGVVLHGLCFNGYSTPLSFLGLKPCGLDAQAGYLLKTDQDFENLKDMIIQSCKKYFYENRGENK